MTNDLKKQPIEGLIFFDIETVRAQKDLLPGTVEYDLFAHKNRDKNTGYVLPKGDLIKLYNKSAALSLTHTKIVCISMAVVVKGTIYVRSYTGSQKSIIERFAVVLFKGLRPCGYNINSYDFPVLRCKALQEGIMNYAPDNLIDMFKKPWVSAESMIDLMDGIKGAHYSAPNMAEACYIAGVPSPKGDIDGSQVSDVYYDEPDGITRIKDYCERDTVANVHLFQRFVGQDLIENVVHLPEEEVEEVTSIDESVEEPKKSSEPKKTEAAPKNVAIKAVKKTKAPAVSADDPFKAAPVLNRIYSTHTFTDKDKQDIIAAFVTSGLHVTKKDWVMLEKILVDLYICNEMFKADSAPKQKEKREEVKEFMSEIIGLKAASKTK